MRTFAIFLASMFLLACGARACPEPVVATADDPPPAEVRQLDAAPRRSSPPGTATIAFLSQGRNAFVGRLEMEPGATVPEHQDPDEEYIVVLEGRGTITIDGAQHEIMPGSTIFMPAGSTVSYQNGDERLVAIQVFAGPGSASKYDRWNPVVESASQ